MSYGELDTAANRFAHWVQTLGIGRGESIALFTPNRLEYLAIWYGLSKVGVVNNQLTGEMLTHCLNISDARHCIVDDETAPAFTAAARCWTIRCSSGPWGRPEAPSRTLAKRPEAKASSVPAKRRVGA
jgi:acyl-CoA synthetase (AMP-forming)/AMP-acid ligase II